MCFRVLLLVVLLVCLGGALWLGDDSSDLRSDGRSADRAGSTSSASAVALNSNSDPEELLSLSLPKRESLADEEPEEIEPDEDEYWDEIASAEEARWIYESLDAVEKGPCSLELTFHDSVSGFPVSGYAHLWRLGAPGNEWWTEGDQLQEGLEVKKGIAKVKGLPPGRYRVYALFAGRRSSSAPEFLVNGDLTSARIPVEMPRPESVRLHLVDANGSPVQVPADSSLEVMSSWSPRRHPGYGELRPKWLVRRMPTDPDVKFSARVGESSMGASPKPWRVVELAGSSVDLGEIRGDPRWYHTDHCWKIRVGGGLPVKVSVVGAGVTDYVAVLPDPVEVLEHFEFSKGTGFDSSKDELRLRVYAVPVAFNKGESISSQWALCRTFIWMSSSSYQHVSVEWNPGQEPMPSIKLQPK